MSTTNFTCRSIDLPPEAATTRQALLWNEICNKTMPSARSPSEARHAMSAASLVVWSRREQVLDSQRAAAAANPRARPARCLASGALRLADHVALAR